MKITIHYKEDDGMYCANTIINGEYKCQWSVNSFEDAKNLLIKDIERPLVEIPPSEEYEIRD